MTDADGPYGKLRHDSLKLEIARREEWLRDESSAVIAAELTVAGVSRSAHLLDMGSGVGVRALLCAEYLGEGAVTGVELNPELVAHATSAAIVRGVKNIRFVTADVRSTLFESDSFDVVRIDSVLWAVPRPEAVLTEARRVLRPGGVLIAKNFDTGGALAFSSGMPTELKLLVEAFAEACRDWGGDPFIGHKLPRLARAAGFECFSVTLTPIVKHGPASAKEGERFWQFYEEWKAPLLDSRRLSELEYARARKAYDEWSLSDDRVAVRTVFSVSARKGGAATASPGGARGLPRDYEVGPHADNYSK